MTSQINSYILTFDSKVRKHGNDLANFTSVKASRKEEEIAIRDGNHFDDIDLSEYLTEETKSVSVDQPFQQFMGDPALINQDFSKILAGHPLKKRDQDTHKIKELNHYINRKMNKYTGIKEGKVLRDYEHKFVESVLEFINIDKDLDDPYYYKILKKYLDDQIQYSIRTKIDPKIQPKFDKQWTHYRLREQRLKEHIDNENIDLQSKSNNKAVDKDQAILDKQNKDQGLNVEEWAKIMSDPKRYQLDEDEERLEDLDIPGYDVRQALLDRVEDMSDDSQMKEFKQELSKKSANIDSRLAMSNIDLSNYDSQGQILDSARNVKSSLELTHIPSNAPNKNNPLEFADQMFEDVQLEKWISDEMKKNKKEIISIKKDIDSYPKQDKIPKNQKKVPHEMKFNVNVRDEEMQNHEFTLKLDYSVAANKKANLVIDRMKVVQGTPRNFDVNRLYKVTDQNNPNRNNISQTPKNTNNSLLSKSNQSDNEKFRSKSIVKNRRQENNKDNSMDKEQAKNLLPVVNNLNVAPSQKFEPRPSLDYGSNKMPPINKQKTNMVPNLIIESNINNNELNDQNEIAELNISTTQRNNQSQNQSRRQESPMQTKKKEKIVKTDKYEQKQSDSLFLMQYENRMKNDDAKISYELIKNNNNIETNRKKILKGKNEQKHVKEKVGYKNLGNSWDNQFHNIFGVQPSEIIAHKSSNSLLIQK